MWIVGLAIIGLLAVIFPPAAGVIIFLGLLCLFIADN